MYQELPFLTGRVGRVQAMEKALLLERKEPCMSMAAPRATCRL